MKTYQAETLVEGLAFPEGPRWHEGRFWFTDQHARAVHVVSEGGQLETVTATEDLPGGLAWLPNGTLLVVYMTERRLMAVSADGPTLYADLRERASFHCNDMVADGSGRVYVGNFGFDLHGGAAVRSAELLLVDARGRVELFSDDVVFPNGSVLTPDGRTLRVAETFAHRIRAFELDDEGRAASQTVWADLGEATPDGICLDVDDAVWVASPGTKELFRTLVGGEIVARCETRGTPYACMLGGADRRDLYICTSETDDPKEAARVRSGRIERAPVDVAGCGFP